MNDKKVFQEVSQNKMDFTLNTNGGHHPKIMKTTSFHTSQQQATSLSLHSMSLSSISSQKEHAMELPIASLARNNFYVPFVVDEMSQDYVNMVQNYLRQNSFNDDFSFELE